PAVTKNQFGEGTAYYVGARMEADFQRDFYANLIEELALKAVLSVDHGRGVSVQSRQISEDTHYVFIMNFTEEEQTITVQELVTDVRTKEELVGDMTLAPYEARV